MNWIVAKMKWILLVSGLLTCTMVQSVFAPDAALRSTFGESLEGPLAEIVVRNWGALIALMGAMLIYAAFRPQARVLVLSVAGLSKLIFIGLVLSFGQQYLGQQAGTVVLIDLAMVLLYATYILGVRRVPAAMRTLQERAQ